MSERHGGKLTFEDGESVSIDLDFEGDILNLSTGGKPVGAWPIKYCRISRTGTGSFLLSIDGEKVVFTPIDVESFALAAAQRFHASSLADRIGVVREAVGSEPSPTARDVEVVPEAGDSAPTINWRPVVALIAVVLVIGIAGAMALSGSGSDGLSFAPLSTSPAPVVTTAEPSLPPLFSQQPAQFVAAWNEVAVEFGVDALIVEQLPIGKFETQIAPFVSLSGTTDALDTIDSVVLFVDPTGGTEDDITALATLGVAIAVAEPELGPSGRRAILEQLGLDVNRPELDGLDGEATNQHARYTLQYYPEFNSLLFSIKEP